MDENDPFDMQAIRQRAADVRLRRCCACRTCWCPGPWRTSRRRRSVNCTVERADPRGGGERRRRAGRGGRRVYAWGLTDPANDVDQEIDAGSGFDLQAAGVQAADVGGKKMLVFTVTMHDRFSNAASNRYDVSIDTNGDGKPGFVGDAADSGQIRAGTPTACRVFIKEVATNRMAASGYLTMRPERQHGAAAVERRPRALRASKATSLPGVVVLAGGSVQRRDRRRRNPWKKALSDLRYLTVGIHGGSSR